MNRSASSAIGTKGIDFIILKEKLMIVSTSVLATVEK